MKRLAKLFNVIILSPFLCVLTARCIAAKIKLHSHKQRLLKSLNCDILDTFSTSEYAQIVKLVLSAKGVSMDSIILKFDNFLIHSAKHKKGRLLVLITQDLGSNIGEICESLHHTQKALNYKGSLLICNHSASCENVLVAHSYGVDLIARKQLNNFFDLFKNNKKFKIKKLKIYEN